jgi:hypothetical protein
MYVTHGLDGGHEWDSQRHVKRDKRTLPQRAPPCTGTGASWWCYTVDNYLQRICNKSYKPGKNKYNYEQGEPEIWGRMLRGS